MIAIPALALAALVLAPAPAVGASAQGAPLSRRERAVHLLSRLAHGPRPGEVERLLELGEEAWLEGQLDPRPGGPVALVERLAEYETLELDPSGMFRFVDVELPPEASREERRERDRRRAVPLRELVGSIHLRQVEAEDQLEEVLCSFWRNHLNVSFTKGYPAQLYLSSYEARVVRDHALGSFPDMLRASAHHPAMMHYLDNHLSRRPPTGEELAKVATNVRNGGGSKERADEAVRIAATRGLNENYARELLELHTLGVDREYTQRDVVAVAEAFTGWGLESGARGVYGFRYDPARHMSDDRRVLGFVVRQDREQDGRGEGERVLDVLARHPLTSEFIAWKLVRHLVADRPPERLVQEVARAYRKEDGDIRAMVRTIVDSDEFWERRHYQAKFKTPNEFLISAIRATGAEVTDPWALQGPLAAMGQPTYHCDDPTGYHDHAEAWLDPGVLAKRWEVALQLAAGELKGVRIPEAFFGDLARGESPLRWMQEMVTKLLPGGADTRTLAMLHEVVREHTAGRDRPDLSVLGPEVVGLLLGSPEFQRQ